MTQKPATGLVALSKMKNMSGLELFEAFVSGDLPHPPMVENIPLRLVEVRHGFCMWETEAPAWFLNPMGTVHGGYAMTVLDSALGCAVQTALEIGEAYTTIEAKVNLTKPIPIGQTLRCEGRVVTKGRRVATSEAKLMDADGKVLAFGTSSLLVFAA